MTTDASKFAVGGVGEPDKEPRSSHVPCSRRELSSIRLSSIRSFVPSTTFHDPLGLSSIRCLEGSPCLAELVPIWGLLGVVLRALLAREDPGEAVGESS